MFELSIIFPWGNIAYGYRDNIFGNSPSSLITVFEREEDRVRMDIERTLEVFRR
jgi:hypothetical protein